MNRVKTCTCRNHLGQRHCCVIGKKSEQIWTNKNTPNWKFKKHGCLLLSGCVRPGKTREKHELRKMSDGRPLCFRRSFVVDPGQLPRRKSENRSATRRASLTKIWTNNFVFKKRNKTSKYRSIDRKIDRNEIFISNFVVSKWINRYDNRPINLSVLYLIPN